MAKTAQFEIGTIVKLKSGGPDMAIKGSGNTSGTHVICQWFAGKKLEQGSFPLESLELVKAEQKGA
jgi:uncharacterized protein YodC (DUF2158 family)